MNKNHLYKNQEILKSLYWKEELSTKRIAEKFGVTHDTIQYWMEKFNIQCRHNNMKRPDISKKLLEKLYLKKKLSMPKIAKLLNTTYDTIWRKVRKYGIKVRDMSEAKMKYTKLSFSGDFIEKAYMLGLRAGDISAARACKQITVLTGTTHLSQLQMFKDVFGKYSKISTFVTTIKSDGRKAWTIYCRLNKSFEFLLNKPKKIPKWILDNTHYFYAFLTGYADCEACWNIHKIKDNKKTRARFQITSGDKIVLSQIKNKLKELGFSPLFRLAHKKGYRKTLGKYNLDIYCLNLNHQKDVLKLAKILLKYSKHKEKIWKMKFVLENLGRNWEETKDKLLDFKRVTNETIINKSSIKELPFLRHDVIDEVLY